MRDAGRQRVEDIRRQGADRPGQDTTESLTNVGHRVHLLDEWSGVIVDHVMERKALKIWLSAMPA
jgi:hypothetical protein